MIEGRASIAKIVPLVAGLITGASPIVRAGETNNAAAAQALFDEGKQLVASGSFAAACAKFAQSQQLDPGGGTLLHLASCHENEGKTASAWSEFNEALSWARRDGRADREAYAKARLKELEPKLVKMTVVVAPSIRVAGLVVRRNGRPLTEAEWGMAVPVDPGEHLIEALAPGHAAWVKRTRVDRQTGNIVIDVPLLAANVPQLAGSTPAPTAGPTTITAEPSTTFAPGANQRMAGIALGISGLLGLGVALGFDLRAHAKASDRDEAARAGNAAATDAFHQQALSAQTTALIVGGAAFAVLGTGIVLYLTAPKSTGNVHVVPQMAANQIGVLLEVVR